MDDKRLEFVATMLAGEGVQHLNPEAIRKRVREASAAYDIMVEELGGNRGEHGSRGDCQACHFYDYGVEASAEPCVSCIGKAKKPNWTPA